MKNRLSILFLFGLLVASASSYAWDIRRDDECVQDDEECEDRRFFEADRTDNYYLRNEASWPTKNQDPLLDSLMR